MIRVYALAGGSVTNGLGTVALAAGTVNESGSYALAGSTQIGGGTMNFLGGSSVTPGCQRSHSRRVTSDRLQPSASSWLRRMCVAMSLSPRPNQLGPAP